MGIRDALRIATGGRPAEPAPKAVLAAAMPLSGPAVKAVNRARASVTTEQWQQEAWYYFDAIGELRGPLVWIAQAVSQAEVHSTDIDPATGKPTGPSEDPRAIAAAALVLGGPAQRAGLLRLLSLCWQVPGEAWIIVRPTPGTGKADSWTVLSGNKVKAKGESWQYCDPMTGMDVTLNPRTDRMIRVWCPHPNDQAKADSACRPALPVCREIEKASQNIAARLDSRLAGNGVWMVPEEVDFPRGDHESASAALMDLFLSTAEMGLQNPGQASSQVPIVLTVPGELIDKATFTDFSTQFDASVVELRTEAINRLGATLDMPNDVARGTQGESNHWSAWQVEESTYKIYIEPLLKSIGDAITEHWFRPALITMGMSPEEAERRELGWDTTAIVARPDDTENLRDLYERILISDAYMLDENGIPEDAVPDEEERTRRFLEKVVLGAPTLLADPAVAAALGLGIEIQPVAAGVDATVTSGGELEPPQPEPVPDNVRALPGTQGQEPQTDPVPEGLVAAAEALVMQALDRAGGRLLTNQNRGQFRNVPRHELHTRIRPERAEDEVDIRFADGVAEAFGMRPATLRVALERYVLDRLKTGMLHDRDDLRWFLR
jgi:hypothetical protein